MAALRHFPFGLGLFAMLFLALTVVLGGRVKEMEKQKFLAPPPEYIEYLHFGFRESMADSLWLRWIQDIDYCQTYLAPMVKLENPIENTVGGQLIDNPRHKICDNSWSFKMLDGVTKLAPKFWMPYATGAITLAVLVEDYPGAKVIFDRAIEQFPNDWTLLYKASYHYQFDQKNPEKAAALLIRAGDAGAPIWVKSLAARLYTKSGQLELGISTLENYKKSLEGDEDAIAEIDKRIAELRAQLQ